ncbi:MAG TPA: FAD-binding oxidoreductase [Terriglobia bacterium]|nr:FAD-binding oxidoreductase [Terriglobia bacterium]
MREAGNTVATAVQSVHSEFATIVGDSCVITDPAVCQTHAVDGLAPSAVVYPQSAEQVAAVLKCAAEHDLAVIPSRNLTKIATGNRPRRYDVALSLKDLNRVWYYEPADLVVSVEPGMKFGDLQHLLARHRLWLPLDPAGDARASLGGILAANSSGPLRPHYGTPRDMVLGMKIATTEGKVIKTGGRVVKNVTGYDISKLMIGSYGTLGVIVEASFKLYPIPAGRATLVLAAGTLEQARELRRAIQRSPLEPMRMVWLDTQAAKLVRESPSAAAEVSAPEIWIEAGGSPRVLERYAGTLEEISRGAGVSVERLEANSAEACWSRIAGFREALAGSWPDSLAHLKAVVPPSASEEFLKQAQQRAAEVKLRLASLALPSVGVVYLSLLEGAREAVPRFNGALRAAAISLGGSLVVESCAPELKSQIDVWGPPGDDFAVMRKLKEAWDPKGILSPGRFVGGL